MNKEQLKDEKHFHVRIFISNLLTQQGLPKPKLNLVTDEALGVRHRAQVRVPGVPLVLAKREATCTSQRNAEHRATAALIVLYYGGDGLNFRFRNIQNECPSADIAQLNTESQ